MKVSENYLAVVDKFIFHGFNIRNMGMSEDQKLRTMIAYEAYQVWLSDKQIRPMDLCRRIAARIYGDMLAKAEHDEHYRDLCMKLKIQPGVPRNYAMLSNDVQTLNHIIGRFSNPSANIEREKVLDASDWLIEVGMKSGNDRAVKSGADLKMKLYKDFDEQQQGYENIAATDVNITGDVSVIKPGRMNYTDEQKRALARKFGMSERDVVDIVKKNSGVYEVEPTDGEQETDFFVKAEEEGK
jgi:hypothetical protein